MNSLPDRTAQHPLARAAVACLAGLLFFLPLLEAPKNLLWLAFVLLWMWHAVFRRAGWGGPWRTSVDLPLAALLFAAALSCALAAPFPQRWNEVGDVLRYVSLGWLLTRSRMEEKHLILLLGAALAGAMLAAMIGWWQWRIVGSKPMLELHSVGHTNHSAIYLCMVALGTLGSLIAAWNRLANGWRMTLIAALLFLTWLLATGESRGALVAYVIGFAAIVVFAAPARWGLRILALFVVLIVTALVTQPYLIDKSISQLTSSAMTTKTSYRVELPRTALIAAEMKPLTGIGPRNFGQMTAERVAAHLERSGKPFEPERYYHSSHAHSLYFNTLAERGIVGSLSLVLLCVSWMIWLRRERLFQSVSERVVRNVGFAAFITIFIAGAFNTSLHHENALLAMFALGLVGSVMRYANGSVTLSGGAHG